MCCCQLAAAVAHFLPVLNSSCLCFVAPKQRPDSGPQNGTTILKLVAQLPNLWPQFWANGICVLPSAKSFLALGARMLVSLYIYIHDGTQKQITMVSGENFPSNPLIHEKKGLRRRRLRWMPRRTFLLLVSKEVPPRPDCVPGGGVFQEA